MTAPDSSVNTSDVQIASSDGVVLEAHVALPDPEAQVADQVGVIFCHGFPSGDVWAERTGADLPGLADRSAEVMGWAAMSFRFRGCGTSTGDFSLQGWVEDVAAAIDYLHSNQRAETIWLCGFGTGGALSVVAAADDKRVGGVAVAGSPADFDDWAANPNRLLAHAKRVGAITKPSFPADIEEWKDQLGRIQAIRSVESLVPRPLLVLHGSEDELVPHFDARLLADAHGQADLRVIQGAGHQLRHDPRAIAVLIGWLGRQRTSLTAAP